MKSHLLLKTISLLCAPILWLSCSSWEEVVAPDEFKPLKIISVSPNTNVYVGDNIIITGENFIVNKEYNQVWFGGNIRGIVDSATTTKLFLKVPDGAQTGNISVSNGIYSDTLKTAFTVVKESPFKTASISFGGFKLIENRSETHYEFGSPVTSYKIDTSILNITNYLIKKNKIPTKDIFFAMGCMNTRYGIPLSDTIFQNFEYFTNPDKSIFHHYTAIMTDIDSLKMTIKKLFIARCDLNNFSGYKECYRKEFELTNVPFTFVNNKIYIKLSPNEISKTWNIYTSSSKTVIFGTYNSWTESQTNGIYEILPDAYFELTLE